MNGSFWSDETLDHIVSSASSAGLYRIVVWIVSYRRLDRIVLAVSGNTGFYDLAGYCKDADYLCWRSKIIQIECT